MGVVTRRLPKNNCTNVMEPGRRATTFGKQFVSNFYNRFLIANLTGSRAQPESWNAELLEVIHVYYLFPNVPLNPLPVVMKGA